MTEPTVAVSAQSDAHDEAGDRERERLLERRVNIIWGLLLFNGLPFLYASVLPFPQKIGQAISACALVLALLLAIHLNPRMLIRSSVVLGMITFLAAGALVSGVRGTAGIGGPVRSLRLGIFLLVLWLLTPWMRRDKLLLARCHLRVMLVLVGSVVAGIFVAPGLAIGDRLRGVIWPVPPPQVGEFGALIAGFGIVGWMSGWITRRRMLALAATGLVMILLSQTRTALIGLLVGVIIAIGSLFLSYRRVRKMTIGVVLLLPLVAAALAPAFLTWFARDQSAQELQGLTGRTQVWHALVSHERSEFVQWFGIGLGNKSFDGRPIDSTWMAVYHEQGLFGIIVVTATLLFLLLAAGFTRAGPRRALAFFIVAYCACASYTEVGLGDATPYLLHIIVAASLVGPGQDDSALRGRVSLP